MWYSFALLSALCYSFRGILEKLIISHTNKYILGFAIRLFAVPFFFIPFFINPHLLVSFRQLPMKFWIAVFMVSFVGTPLETIFYYEALQEEEVSLVIPILSLSPVLDNTKSCSPSDQSSLKLVASAEIQIWRTGALGEMMNLLRSSKEM